METLIADIWKFKELSGLSDYRVGWLLAKNGRLLTRMREGTGRHWPETQGAIAANLEAQVDARGLDKGAFRCLSTPGQAS